MFKENLKHIISGKNLTAVQMEEMIFKIFSGRLTDAQVAGFMVGLATKGETVEELTGAARIMRKNAVKIQVMGQDTIIDTCGTGGDSANTFNISTTTAFVAAGCNVIVAKHGNRSVSSKCGSADLVEALGINLDVDPEIVEEAIAEIGIGFAFAPRYHGAMRFAAKARQQLGIKSIFNMIGPLSNPAGANCQLLGVYAPKLTEMFALALHKLGTKRAFVVHGHDGLDEISVCAPTRISELNQGQIKTYDIHPEVFFKTLSDPKDIKGGDLKTNLQITKDVLNGKKGPKRNIVLINTGAALVAAGKTDSLKEGIQMAEESIDSRKAITKLNDLIAFTQDNS
ncbi:anthranilate phosphoribosyltransferase [Desulfobacula sp.]